MKIYYLMWLCWQGTLWCLLVHPTTKIGQNQKEKNLKTNKSWTHAMNWHKNQLPATKNGCEGRLKKKTPSHYQQPICTIRSPSPAHSRTTWIRHPYLSVIVKGFFQYLPPSKKKVFSVVLVVVGVDVDIIAFSRCTRLMQWWISIN